MPKTKYKFSCPLFQIRVYLVVGDKKQLEAFHVYDENYHDAECHSIEVEEIESDGSTGLKSRHLLVWVKEHDDYYGMVHETVHLVKRIFEIMGIPFNEENDEIIAYYQNYWVRKFWRVMANLIEYKKEVKTNGKSK